MKKLIAALTTVTIAGCLPAKAAQFWVSHAETDGYAIHVKGDIVKGDASRFANAVRKAGIRLADATVYLDSPGGLVIEGISIAHSIKKYGWSTYVASGTTCLSMCANIWLAGRTRYASEKAHIGFHSLSDKRNPNERDEQANAAFLSFYREMGVSQKAGRVFLAAEPGADAIWLTAELARGLNVAITPVTFEQEMAGNIPPGKNVESSKTASLKTEALRAAYLLPARAKSLTIDIDLLTQMPIAQQRPSTLPGYRTSAERSLNNRCREGKL
jgi:membrane-bound ClpP family serine protease